MDATDDQDYLTKGIGKGTFEFNEIGINFSTIVLSDLRIGAQVLAFDFAPPHIEIS